MNGDALVIGYGNTLRRDDGVGPRAAEAVAGWCVLGVSTIATHQLRPELAIPLADARLAVFVDAEPAAAVRVRALEPEETAPSLGHTSDPRQLLSIALGLFGSCPPAWLVTVPAVDLGHGEGLSATAAAGLDEALRRIAGLLELEGPRTDYHRSGIAHAIDG